MNLSEDFGIEQLPNGILSQPSHLLYNIRPDDSHNQTAPSLHYYSDASLIPQAENSLHYADIQDFQNSNDTPNLNNKLITQQQKPIIVVGSATTSTATLPFSVNYSLDAHQALPCQSTSLHITGGLKFNNNKCHGCGFEISERFLLKVGVDAFFHENCLRCSSCDRHLAVAEAASNAAPISCYIKNNRVYCKDDHLQLFTAKCDQCTEPLRPDDLVFRCYERRFHVRCFQCAYCAQPLKTGDHYAYVNGQVVCERDYSLLFLCGRLPMGRTTAPSIDVKPPNELPLLNTNHVMPSIFEFDRLRNQALHHHHHHHSHHNGSSKKIPKRPRTILNAHQRKAFKYVFEHGSKPSRKVREQLARDTGLSVRVVQVWFQNQRAKIKKEQRKRETDKHSSSAASITVSTDSDGKSAMDDEMKSPLGSIKSGETESELEDFDLDEEVLSGRSSASQPSTSIDIDSSGSAPTDQSHKYSSQPSVSANEEVTVESNSANPIDKLYRMHHTYFAFT